MTPTSIDLTVVTYTLGIYAAIVISPGPNFALVSRLALKGQRNMCRGAILGLAIAATFYAILAMLGLAALLGEIGWLARAVQIAGGAYLIYIGIQAWVTSGHQRGRTDAVSLRPNARPFLSGVRLGVLVNLSNPKAVAFFVGLYAVAVPADATVETRLAVLAGGAALELGWYNLVTGILSWGPFQRFYLSFSKLIERTIGTILIFFGARLVLDR